MKVQTGGRVGYGVIGVKKGGRGKEGVREEATEPAGLSFKEK